MARFGKKQKPLKGLVNFIRNSNLRLILLCIILSAYGCILVYSAAHGYGDGWKGSIIQIAASAGGLLLAILISRIDCFYQICFPRLSCAKCH